MGQMEEANRRQGWMSQREDIVDTEACRNMGTDSGCYQKCVCHVVSNVDGDSRGRQWSPGATNATPGIPDAIAGSWAQIGGGRCNLLTTGSWVAIDLELGKKTQS